MSTSKTVPDREKRYEDLTDKQQAVLDTYEDYPAGSYTKIAFEADADLTAQVVQTVNERYPHLLEERGVYVG